MCGILAAFNAKIKNKRVEDVNDFIINQYEDQISRGQKGFGIIRIDEKRNIEKDRATEPVKFLLDLYLKKSKMIIAHHRTPTSTENIIQQTHPMSLSNKALEYDYEIIHNGIISNDDELYEKHKELGFKYQTEMPSYEWDSVTRDYEESTKTKWNDSEAIAIELALFIEKKVSAIGTDNTAAFIALQINKKTRKAEKVFWGKNGISADLAILKTKEGIRISSEGEGAEVEVNKLFSFKINDPKMIINERKMEFKKKEIPVIEAKKTETPTNLPTTEISTGNQTETKKPTIIYREWYDKEIDDYPSAIDYITEIEEGYIDSCKLEITEKIKEADSQSITHIIDDTLDEELDKIAEVMSAYKTALLNEKFEDGGIRYYSAQMFRIIKAMKVITDLAETDYKEKQKLEQEAEDLDMEYLKNGWEGWNGRTHEKHSETRGFINE